MNTNGPQIDQKNDQKLTKNVHKSTFNEPKRDIFDLLFLLIEIEKLALTIRSKVACVNLQKLREMQVKMTDDSIFVYIKVQRRAKTKE